VHCALTGVLDESYCLALESVKLGVNKKIEKVIYGELCTSKEVRITAINAVRVGAFDKVRLGNFADIDDKGTTADPLLSFRNQTDPLGKVMVAIGHMQTVASLAMPLQGIAIHSFFSELKIQIDRFNGRGAAWADLSKWLAAVFKRVATAAKLAVSESRHDPELFPLAWLKDESDYRTTLQESIFDSRADEIAGSKRGRSEAKPSKKKKDKERKTEDEEGSRVAKDELAKGNKITPRGEGGKPSQAQLKAMNAKYPKKDGKLPCWWNHAGHECQYGTDCSFYHN
jgi:hypothetical protein